MQAPAPEGAGGSLSDHFAAAARQGARPKEVVNKPSFPKELNYLWSLFVRLDGMRDTGLNGLSRIKATEVESYTRQIGEPLVPWEVKVLYELDDVRIAAATKAGAG